jgi:hypothetical protein
MPLLFLEGIVVGFWEVLLSVWFDLWVPKRYNIVVEQHLKTRDDIDP